MNPANTKKGVFTSHSKDIDQRLPQNQTLDPRRQLIANEQQFLYLNRNNLQQNSNNLTIKELNRSTRVAQSNKQTVSRPELHFNYAQGSHSSFVPPPPQRFLVNSGQSYSQPSHASQLPIYSGGHVQTVQTVQPLYQSIKRTYVPHHIYNEIPVMNSESKQYVENQEEIGQQQHGLEESDQRMLQQYQKLYQCFEEQRHRNQELRRKLQQYEQRKESSSVEVRQVIQTKEVLVDKPKKIDIKLLAQIIIKKNQDVIGRAVQRKRNSCINKLRALFSQEESAIKTTIVRSTEEFTQSKIKTK